MHMSLFISLVMKILPLYLNIGMGYIAGKKLNTNRETIANIIFFMISPIIIFNGVLHVPLEARIMTLPLFTFGIGCLLCLIFYTFSKKIWDDSSKNLMGYSAGTGNAGYFGLPVALLLFDVQIEGIYILLLLGMTLYENSLGYYILAKGTHSAMDCLKQVAKLPALYACVAGLLLNVLQVPIPEMFADFMNQIKGTFTVLGMMVVGLGLASLSSFKADRKFLGMTILAKFFAWPLLVLMLNYMDTAFFGIYSDGIHQAMLLISIVPIGVNTVILATLLKSQPEKAATAVIISTLLAVIYVPFMVSLFIV